MAVERKNIKIAQALLKVEGIDVNIKNKNGRNPLHMSINRGYKKMIKVLKATGFYDVEATDNNRSSCYRAVSMR